MDFTGWLRTIYEAEPMSALPPAPDGIDVDMARENRWLRLDRDGWRVTDDARRLFGWTQHEKQTDAPSR